MHFSRSTPVRRLWLRTVAFLLFALVLLALAIFLLYQDRNVRGVTGALVFLIFSLAALLAAISHSYTADCPTCGARQEHLGGIHRCDHCLAYGEVVDGEYRELEADRIANSPVFAAPVPEECFMPKLCSACGAPSSRLMRLRIIRNKFAFNLDVPHCDLHTRGADLTSTNVKTGKDWHELPEVKFASYSFYREYLKRNGLEPERK